MKISINLINYNFDSLKHSLYISNTQIMMGSLGTKINRPTKRLRKISWEPK